jgi:hypothetical protein
MNVSVSRDVQKRRESRSRLAIILAGLHTMLSIAAFGAGQAFVRDPSGAALGMTTEPLQGSPFPDYRIPGLFLGIVIGGANLISALALWRKHPLGSLMSLATGVLLIVWIAIQTAIIGFLHWSQWVWWWLFIAVTLLAGDLARRDRRQRRGTPDAS